MPGRSWRFQTGNTSEFALDLALVEDPDDVEFLDADVRTSWGTLSIWASGVDLCSVRGRDWSEEGTHCYLLRFVEWMIDVWVPLLHEERIPLVDFADDAAEGALRGARAAETAALVDDDYGPAERWQEWKHRHSLRSAEPEALLPDLYLRRRGDALEFSIGSAPLPGADTGATSPASMRYAFPSSRLQWSSTGRSPHLSQS